MSKKMQKSHSVLVLSASYQPLSIVSLERAYKLLLNGKATTLDSSGKTFISAHREMDVPFVIRLNYMVKQGHSADRARFSKRGVLIRDNHTCAYCGEKATTIDHVVPRALGGPSTYGNCVAACFPCNSKKADRPLEVMGWKLKFNPDAPRPLLTMFDKATKHTGFEAWKPYILMFEPALQKRIDLAAAKAAKVKQAQKA